jgi:hypothetical protein
MSKFKIETVMLSIVLLSDVKLNDVKLSLRKAVCRYAKRHYVPIKPTILNVVGQSVVVVNVVAPVNNIVLENCVLENDFVE